MRGVRTGGHPVAVVVAPAVPPDAVGVFLVDEAEPVVHSREHHLERLLVAVALVHEQWQLYTGVRPRWSTGFEGAPGPIGRGTGGDIGEPAGRRAGIEDVDKPLGHEGPNVVGVGGDRGEKQGVGHPPHALVALRAVRRDLHVVRFQRTDHELVDLLQEGLRTREPARAGHVGADGHAFGGQ